MRLRNLTLSLFILSIALTSCKKTGTAPDVEQPTPLNVIEAAIGARVTLPGAHDGALYSVRTIRFSESGYLDTTLQGFAWFGNTSKTSSAGNVFLNEVGLRPDSLAWYCGKSVYPNDDAQWDVSGTETYPAFSTTDMASYGFLQSYTIPNGITKIQGLTVKFSASDGASTVVVSVSDGQGRRVIKNVGTGPQTVTFTNAELALMLEKGENLTLQIMPATVNLQNIGDRNYYFVKLASFNKNIQVIH